MLPDVPSAAGLGKASRGCEESRKGLEGWLSSTEQMEGWLSSTEQITLAEDPGSIPRIHVAAHNYSSRGSDTLFSVHSSVHMCKQTTHTEKIKMFFLNYEKRNQAGASFGLAQGGGGCRQHTHLSCGRAGSGQRTLASFSVVCFQSHVGLEEG